jgi:hypothetical protein
MLLLLQVGIMGLLFRDSYVMALRFYTCMIVRHPNNPPIYLKIRMG